MTDRYQLPVKAHIGGKTYHLHADFRDILEIFSYLQDASIIPQIRWRIALALFYEEPVDPEHMEQARQFFVEFVENGHDCSRNVPQLLDWQKDAPMIIADINRAAGQEIRALPFVHWWTFLAWFDAIGEGQLLTVVSIRDKLRRGKKLDDWEKEYYCRNKARIEQKKQYSAEEIEEQERLNAMLNGAHP